MESLIRDIHYGIRSLVRTPGFTLVAVLILALGIGANSTIFTLVDALFLQSPPAVADPDRLVRVTRATEYTISGSLSYPDYIDYRENNSVFADLAAYEEGGTLMMAEIGGSSIQVRALLVSGNYFDVLGVPAHLGRTFLPEEDATPAVHPVAVVSFGFWQRELGRDPNAAGRQIRLNGHSFTIVGVAAEAYRGVGPTEVTPDLWLPLTTQPLVMSANGDLLRRVEGAVDYWLQGLGRLKPGVELETARAAMIALAKRLEREYPSWNEGVSVALTDDFQYRPSTRESLARLVKLLTFAVAIVLLIACANVAILLLARAAGRRGELGIRRALGASQPRVIGQLLAEGLLLALAGGTAGLLLAAWLSDTAAALLPLGPAVPAETDTRVLAFTLALCLFTTLLFALAPAWLTTRWRIGEALHGAPRASERLTLRNGLVVAQVSLAIILVSGAGLFLRSFARAQSVDPGFETENRLIASVNLRSHGYGEEEGMAFVRRALERLNGLPGVQRATTSNRIPFRGSWTGGFEAEGVESPQGGFETGFNTVGPDYFRTMGIPLLAGRAFNEADRAGAPAVVVVNETLARSVWPGVNPIGRVVVREPLRATVVGLARDAKYYDLGETPQPQMYLSVAQFYLPSIHFIVHARGQPGRTLQLIEDELRALDPSLVVYQLRTMDDTYADVLAAHRVLAVLVTLFAGLALTLAAIGLYGVLSYQVVRGTRELGIRVALGAGRGQLAGLVLRRGLRLALLGIALGGGGAWLSAQAVGGFLFELSARDPLTFAIVPLVLASVACLASYFPARRAASVDPMVALRQE